MPDNFDDKQKQQLKIVDIKKKKAMRDNLNVNEKEQMRIYKLCMITSMMNKKSI